uniref:flavin-containing monooxygenase n=1 Tax=Rhodococcus qingshengii TaxID=334542 RepID=UPI001C4E0734|nr:NAD(P)/FAD-dependent oxidoreductase [Rhodococcus qingshengii]
MAELALPDQGTETNETDFDVIIVGAGLSGIGAACHLLRERPDTTYAVLESRPNLGGTWDLFRYPGVRSDSDMFTLGYSFRPWSDPRAIADGDSILSYLRDTAEEYGVDQRIRFGHRVIDASWDSATSRWTVTAEMVDAVTGAGTTVEFTCRWLSVCAGYYRYDRAHRPHFDGESDFDGAIVSPQSWPQSLDWTDKRVVVIGSGATAITLVPTLAEKAEHVTMLQRTPTYIVSLPAEDRWARRLERFAPAGIASRIMFWKNVIGNIISYETARRFPSLSKRVIRRETERALGKDFPLEGHFTPPYDPWDQRVCVVPDGDLFQALRDGNADIVTDTISRFLPQGVETSGGKIIAADIVVAATGLSMIPLGGMTLTVDGQPISLPDTVVYKGMMLSDVPNFNLVIGYTNNSWTLKADLVSEFVARALTYLDTHGYDTVTPCATGVSATGAFVDLRSGYVARGIGAFPRQGEDAPWRLHQNYLRDLKLFRTTIDEDPSLRFGRRTMRSASPALIDLNGASHA